MQRPNVRTLLIGGFALLYSFITILMLAHLLVSRQYFRGAPTQDVDNGQTILGISLASSLVTVYFALFIHFTNRRSIPIFSFLYLGFIVSILTSMAVVYFFRAADPAPEKLQDYVVKYFKAHGKSPPFFENIQNKMNGYCCGGMSYLDYVSHTRDMFKVPRSCCFGQLKKAVSQCEKNNWKYLYMFFSSLIPEILLSLEKHHDYLDDLETVVKSVAMEKSGRFIDLNYKAMVDDRITSITSSNASAADAKTYQLILADAGIRNTPSYDLNRDPYVSRKVFEKATEQIDFLMQQFTDPWSMNFLPMGCWTLITEMRTSKWKGFNELSQVKEKVTFLVEGAFAMAVLYAASLTIFVICFVTVSVFNCCGPSSSSPASSMANDDEKDKNKNVTKEDQELDDSDAPLVESNPAVNIGSRNKSRKKRGGGVITKLLSSTKSKRNRKGNSSSRTSPGHETEDSNVNVDPSDAEETEDDELQQLISVPRLQNLHGEKSTDDEYDLWSRDM